MTWSAKASFHPAEKFFLHMQTFIFQGTANHVQEFLIDRLFSRNNFCILCKGMNSALLGDPSNDTLWRRSPDYAGAKIKMHDIKSLGYKSVHFINRQQKGVATSEGGTHEKIITNICHGIICCNRAFICSDFLHQRRLHWTPILHKWRLQPDTLHQRRLP